MRARRRDELRRAAYETAGRYGFQALTISAVARHAGVSKGIVHHYFKNKQDLIEQAVRFAHAQYRNAVLSRLRRSTSPSDRLWSVVAGNFDETIFLPHYRRLWLSIFEAARADARLARLCEIVDRRTVTHVRCPMRHLVAPAEVEAKSFTLMALIDGCWFLAVADPHLTRDATLTMIAHFLRANVPRFDMGAIERCDSPRWPSSGSASRQDSLGGPAAARKDRDGSEHAS